MKDIKAETEGTFLMKNSQSRALSFELPKHM
jgi:hypothetical protein